MKKMQQARAKCKIKAQQTSKGTVENGAFFLYVIQINVLMVHKEKS
jgi:hypothetical protein